MDSLVGSRRLASRSSGHRTPYVKIRATDRKQDLQPLSRFLRMANCHFISNAMTL